MNPICLFRYDTETTDAAKMRGFLPAVVDVHRKHAIPATFFCTGAMLEQRADEFRDFATEVAGDPLFDVQCHSYSHIGIGYKAGQPLDVLRDDYERAFAAHEAIFGRRPIGVSLCGTSGKDGPRLKGFDATEKARAEFAMLASLGMRMVNCFLTQAAEDRDFCSYACFGRPDIMGFPSGHSDTVWMMEKTPDSQWRRREPFGEAVGKVVAEIGRRGRERIHMPIMLHDWAAWTLAPDRDLDHVKRFAEAARAAGFELLTHACCLDRPGLWMSGFRGI